MTDHMHDTIQIYLKVNRKDIVYMANIINSYEGVAIMRTKDPYLAVVEWQVSPDFLDEAFKLIDALKKEIEIEFTEWRGYA